MLLTTVRPEDLIVRVTGVRWVRDRWWIDATIQWSGAAPEDTGSESLAIGVSFRIVAVGPP